MLNYCFMKFWHWNRNATPRSRYSLSIEVCKICAWHLRVLRRQTTMLVICSQCFWKGCICFISVFFIFSFQHKFNNHLKVLTTTIWSMISRCYHCYFILRWNVLFSHFCFQLVNGLSDFIFSFCKMFGRMAIKKPSFKFSMLPIFF